MKYQISEMGTGLKIEITELDETTDTVLAAFKKCSEGQCNCPTNEYANLEKLDIERSDQFIRLEMTAKDGLSLDIDEIEKCLKSTIESAAGK